MSDKADQSRKEALLKQAREHWKECTSDIAERDNRIRGREDAAFAAGDQWDEADKRQREQQRRPCLVFNRILGFLHMVENEQRRNRTSILISPVDSDLDPDTARVDQGLIRYIQYNSRAEMAVQAAFMEACRTGLGCLKLTGEYVGGKSFDQDLVIEQIPDAINRVWWDVFAKLPDRSDSRYVFESVTLPHAVHKAKYPNAELSNDAFFADLYGNQEDDWLLEDSVRVATYYYVEEVERKIVQLSDGSVEYFEDVAEGASIVAERTMTEKVVKIATLNGYEVLDETEWKGSIIPVFPVMGEETFVKGRRVRFSLTHFARYPQMMFNFYRSNEAEAVGLAPKSPWVAAEGQIEGYEQIWESANRLPHSVLPYKPATVAGVAVPPPQRNTAEPPIQALSLGAAQAADDMKAAVSIYDPSLGERSNETSGTAIAQRQQQAGLANLHFADNLGMAMQACGRAIVEVKPFYYDTDRAVRIIGEDEKQEVVRINAPFVDAKGIQRQYDLTSSKYDVRVSSGPSLMTQRQEAWAAMTEWVRSSPQLMEIAGDIIFRNSDIPGAEEIAERMKKVIDPKLTADKDEGQMAIPPQVQAQMQALQQLVEQLTAALNQASDEAAIKKAELDSKERVANLDAMVKVAIAEANLGSAEAIEELRQSLAVIQAQMEATRAQNEQDSQPEESGADTGAGYPKAA